MIYVFKLYKNIFNSNYLYNGEAGDTTNVDGSFVPDFPGIYLHIRVYLDMVIIPRLTLS